MGLFQASIAHGQSLIKPVGSRKLNTEPTETIMRALFLDPAGGIGGDMFLAALCHLGLDPDPLGPALSQAFDQPGMEVAVYAKPRSVNGLAGMGLRMEAAPDQPLRHLPDIEAVIGQLPLSEAVRSRSLKAFHRLAQVEAAVHGLPLDRVHFHEVGAVDTLVDVVGAFWGLEKLGVEHVTSAPLPWFSGMVHCAHGLLPLPAPATAKLLAGKPVYPTPARDELITPTGALIVDQVADGFDHGPRGTVLATGVGYGDRVMEGRVNGLRLFLYESGETGNLQIN